jgi:hypothetical protein
LADRQAIDNWPRPFATKALRGAAVRQAPPVLPSLRLFQAILLIHATAQLSNVALALALALALARALGAAFSAMPAAAQMRTRSEPRRCRRYWGGA